MIELIAALALAADPPVLRDNPSARPGQSEPQPPIRRQPFRGPQAPMPVYGVDADDRGVTVKLLNACQVTKSDFTAAVSKEADRPMVLFARRSVANNLVLCGPRLHPIAFTWSYDELGLKPGQQFSLANPLVMAP